MPEDRHWPARVVVAGAGPAALEGALALQHLAQERAAITLVAPEPSFVYRPLAVAEAFGLADPPRWSLAALAAERGFERRADTIARVDAPGRRVRLARGATLPYDALLLALGAAAGEAVPGALTFRGPEDAETLHARLLSVPAAAPARVAFVAPRAVAWTLPIYELALLTAHWARSHAVPLEPWLVTHETRPLEIFGAHAAAAIAELLERSGVRLWSGAEVESVQDGRLWVTMEGGMPFEHVVALPEPVPRHVPGLPADESGFVPIDSHGRVAGTPGVYAAGDMTGKPIRQGGLATQQADAAAAAIAAACGAPIVPEPYRPRLRAVLLTGERPLYLRHRAGDAGTVDDEPPWWPPDKIVGRELGPYLASHPELREPGGLAAASRR